VELAGANERDAQRFLVFSSFGLSLTDLATGAPTLAPGAGFNGVLIDPGTVHVVVRALASSGRSRIVSAPRILVNDNGTGTLSSVAEAPFTSVNASQTVATTSFAGYASAGTTVSVTPHIAEGDHLQLDYSVTLNSFTGTGAQGVPPPRQTDTINSKVTVPDGYAVVIGGLTRTDLGQTVSKVPILGDIPGLKYLFSSRSETSARTTLVVFLRPVILRDDRFEDLKYLSAGDLEAAGQPPNLPRSDPMLMP
jgi:type II secretory pathway component GspD/PulD (secretin)